MTPPRRCRPMGRNIAETLVNKGSRETAVIPNCVEKKEPKTTKLAAFCPIFPLVIAIQFVVYVPFLSNLLYFPFFFNVLQRYTKKSNHTNISAFFMKKFFLRLFLTPSFARFPCKQKHSAKLPQPSEGHPAGSPAKSRKRTIYSMQPLKNSRRRTPAAS